MYLYLGIIETLGNAVANASILLLAANEIFFHVERRKTPRIKHVTSIDDLNEDFISLKTKLNFLEDNRIRQLSRLIDTDLRNDIEIRNSEIYVRGRKARELVPPSTVNPLKACNTVVEILDRVARDRGIRKEGVKP